MDQSLLCGIRLVRRDVEYIHVHRGLCGVASLEPFLRAAVIGQTARVRLALAIVIGNAISQGTGGQIDVAAMRRVLGF
jgi:hypothetical protein